MGKMDNRECLENPNYDFAGTIQYLKQIYEELLPKCSILYSSERKEYMTEKNGVTRECAGRENVLSNI